MISRWSNFSGCGPVGAFVEVEIVFQGRGCELPPISFFVRTKSNKLDGVVRAVRAICAEDNGIVSLLSAGCAVKENNQKIAFDGATVETAKVSFERLTQSHRALADYSHFFSDSLFY